MKFSSACLIPALAMILSCHAVADDDIDTIRANLTRNHPGLNIRSVQPAPIAGLYEVYTGGQLLYVSKKAEFVLVGATLVEDASKRNLTTERMKELTKIKFDTLPLQNAIEVKKGTGEYKFAVFSDPDCPYCKNMEQGLEKLGTDNYTAYVFLFPLEDIHPDAKAKAEAIWCAKDKSSAWHDWMINGKMPEKTTCETPLEQNKKLADQLGVSGTPTIYLSDGTQTNSPQELVTAINKK